MSSRPKSRRRTWSGAFFRPWLIAAGIGLVLGAALLSLDSGESSRPLADFAHGEDPTQPFRPDEAMIKRAETEFRDAFAAPASPLGTTSPDTLTTAQTSRDQPATAPADTRTSPTR